jgi:hypothetical protein
MGLLAKYWLLNGSGRPFRSREGRIAGQYGCYDLGKWSNLTVRCPTLFSIFCKIAN